MNTFSPMGDSGSVPTQLDVATRVDVQDGMLDKVADSVAEVMGKRVEAQEANLKPIYKRVVKNLQDRISQQASDVAPVGMRLLTGINSRIATTGSQLDTIRQRVADAMVTSDVPIKIPTQPNIAGGIPEPLRGILPVPATDTSTVPIVLHGGTPGTTPTSPPMSPPAPPTPEPIPGVGACPVPAPPVIACPAPVVTVVMPGGTPPATPPVSPGTPPVPPVPPGTPVPVPPVLTVSPPVSPGTPPVPPGTPVPVSPPPLATPLLTELPPVQMDWCVPDVCGAAVTAVRRVRETQPASSQELEPTDGTVLGAAAYYTISLLGTSLMDAVKRFVPGNLAEHVFAGAGEAAGRYATFTISAGEILRSIHLSGVRDEPAAAVLMARIGAASMTATETGIPIDYMTTTDQYLLHYTNPQFIPSQAEIDSAWMSGTIDDGTWQCWTMAQGNIPTCRTHVLQSMYTHAAIDQVISLYRQGIIPDESELRKQLRRAGVVDDRDFQYIVRATQNVPTPSDVQHYNIRDVFDPTKLGLEDIKQEYQNVVELQELYYAIGNGPFTIRDSTGKVHEYDPAWLDFLASYDEASPTQSYDMLHRLRPGREKQFAQVVPDVTPDVLKKTLIGCNIQPTSDGKGSIVIPRPVDLYTVAKNLKEKDYNPVWRDRLAAISYNVVGRIDLRRLYNTGVFGKPHGVKGFSQDPDGTFRGQEQAETELIERYMDAGYTRKDASLLAYYTASEWDKSQKEKVPARKLTQICTALKLGVYDAKTATTQLTAVVGDAKKASDYVDGCLLDHNIDTVKQTIAAIRSQFLRGVLDRNDAHNRLVRAGVQDWRIRELLELWDIQLMRKDKEASANRMCMWYADGSLSRSDFRRRLINIGYDQGDADRIIKHCELGVLAKQQKVRDRQLKAQEREKNRILALQNKQAKELAAAQAKRMTQFLATRTEKHLTEWLQDGTITQQEVYQALLMKGFTDADATRWLEHYRKSSGGTGGKSGNKP